MLVQYVFLKQNQTEENAIIAITHLLSRSSSIEATNSFPFHLPLAFARPVATRAISLSVSLMAE